MSNTVSVVPLADLTPDIEERLTDEIKAVVEGLGIVAEVTSTPSGHAEALECALEDARNALAAGEGSDLKRTADVLTKALTKALRPEWFGEHGEVVYNEEDTYQ